MHRHLGSDRGRKRSSGHKAGRRRRRTGSPHITWLIGRARWGARCRYEQWSLGRCDRGSERKARAPPEIGAEIVPSRLLLNKIDRVSEADRAALRVKHPDAILLSAKSP